MDESTLEEWHWEESGEYGSYETRLTFTNASDATSLSFWACEEWHNRTTLLQVPEVKWRASDNDAWIVILYTFRPLSEADKTLLLAQRATSDYHFNIKEV